MIAIITIKQNTYDQQRLENIVVRNFVRSYHRQDSRVIMDEHGVKNA